MCDHFELVATKTLSNGAATSFQYRATLRRIIFAEQAIEEFAAMPVVEPVAWKSDWSESHHAFHVKWGAAWYVVENSFV
ncbi:MAG: hypothetical protein O2931_02645 [Planctomycetota bacterium]|nr:hypothetical protein [Planctomycetota bacterium]MDA1177674.1 hypothetical protein [Planctomycetota bacterium]